MASPRHITVAGTFDRLHAGHRSLISLAAQIAPKISIGVSSDDLVKGKVLADQIESFEIRQAAVSHFLKSLTDHPESLVFHLEDMYGIALTDRSLDSIYVTEESIENARIINYERKKRNMKELTLYEAPLVTGEDNTIISSSRIRTGIIDPDGMSYLTPFDRSASFSLSDADRGELKTPLGDVIYGSSVDTSQAGRSVINRLRADNPPLVVSVGDIVTRTLNELTYPPDISFIDNITARKAIRFHHVADELRGPYRNPAGTIQAHIAYKYATAVADVIIEDRHIQFEIEGEEDLLGLPAIMLAPLGSVVLYGLVDRGVVYVRVDAALKNYCRTLLGRFRLQ